MIDTRNQFRKFCIMNTEIANSFLELMPDASAKVRLWCYMIDNMGNWNTITLMQSKLANELGMSRQHMNRIIKELEAKKFIVKNGKSQNNNTYMINPSRFWNGKNNEHNKGIAMFNKLLQNYHKA